MEAPAQGQTPVRVELDGLVQTVEQVQREMLNLSTLTTCNS